MVWSWNSGKTARAPQPGDVLQADGHGLPAWARTTGEILPFHGLPKTPGFPHYLDGLPMAVVSQLGYVDRGIGKRGIFYLLDDFVEGNPMGVSAGVGGVGANHASSDRWQVFGDTANVDYARADLGGDISFASGALYLLAQSGTSKGVLVTPWNSAFGWRSGERQWFSTRVGVGNLGKGWAAVGLGKLEELDEHIDGYLTTDPATHFAQGLYFLMQDGDRDWSFVVAERQVDDPTVTVLGTGLCAAAGITLTDGQYVPLAYTVDAHDVLRVYVDGQGVLAVPADQPTWARLRSQESVSARFAPFMARETSAGSSDLVRLLVDHILAAQETQADAD